VTPCCKVIIRRELAFIQIQQIVLQLSWGLLRLHVRGDVPPASLCVGILEVVDPLTKVPADFTFLTVPRVSLSTGEVKEFLSGVGLTDKVEDGHLGVVLPANRGLEGGDGCRPCPLTRFVEFLVRGGEPFEVPEAENN
jgi:hypothetical protein